MALQDVRIIKACEPGTPAGFSASTVLFLGLAPQPTSRPRAVPDDDVEAALKRRISAQQKAGIADKPSCPGPRSLDRQANIARAAAAKVRAQTGPWSIQALVTRSSFLAHRPCFQHIAPNDGWKEQGSTSRAVFLGFQLKSFQITRLVLTPK